MGPWLGCFSLLENEQVGLDLSQLFSPSLSPLSPPGLILPLAVSILRCWDCWGLGVGIPDIEVGGPGVGLSESFHQSFQSIISSFPFVPVTFLEVPWYGTSLFDLTFISETMGRFHAHPF